MNEIVKILEDRTKLHDQLIGALSHMDREAALHTILAWSSIDDLRRMVRIVCQEEPEA